MKSEYEAVAEALDEIFAEAHVAEKNTRHNGDKRPLCGHCFKKPNIG